MSVSVNRTYLLGEYSLESEKRALSVAGAPVRLTAKPFQVLIYLIENRDRVIPRSELLDRFWDGSEVYGDSVSKCIGAIRKALNDSAESPRFIQTRYSEGYRYIGPLAEQVIQPTPPFPDIQSSGVETPGPEPEPIIAAPPLPPAVREKRHESIRRPGLLTRIPALKTRHRIAIPALIFIVVVLGTTAVISYKRHSNAANQAVFPIRSIAVMPFKNLTGDPAQEYFSDGLTEDFITELAKIDGLKVISRSSVFTLKGKEIDPRDAGKKLGVASILEGSVAAKAGAVRVDVRLVSSADGRVLWQSGPYDRALKDIFEIQDSIAGDVVGELKGKIWGDSTPVRRGGPSSVEAYREDLKGRYFINNQYQNLQTAGAEDNLQKAAEHFHKAFQADPNYAAAYAGLADAETGLIWFSTRDTVPLISEAKAAALKATQLDDSLADAHTALATVYIHEWNFPAARQSYQRGLSLNPNSGWAHDGYATYLMAKGQVPEMLEQIELAEDLDPLNTYIVADRASLLYMARRYDEAIAEFRKGSELTNDYTASGNIGGCYLGKKMYAEAIDIIDRARAANTVKGQAPFLTASLAVAYALAGQKEKATHLSEALSQMSKTQYVPKTFFAYISAALGDNNRAFEMLEAAYNEHDSTLIGLTTHPWFDSLRADPRFDSLVRRLGLS